MVPSAMIRPPDETRPPDDRTRHAAGRSLYGRSTARLPTGPASWPTRQGTCPIMVLRARCGRWLLTTIWHAWPADATSLPDPCLWYRPRVQYGRPPTASACQVGRPRTASACQGGGVDRPLEEAPVGQAHTIGLDIAKRVFQAHGADASGRVVFCKRLVRAKVLAFFAAQPPCTVAMEACAGAHHGARELGKLGHTVRLIPPAYV